MKCPNCGGEKSRVIDTRTNGDGNIDRVRKCQACGFPWGTEEKCRDAKSVGKEQINRT